MHVRFKLKTLLLIFVAAAFALTLLSNGIPHSYIQSTFVDNDPVPRWWPSSWKAEYESLRLSEFEHSYLFDESQVGLAVQQMFRMNLDIHLSSHPIGAPEIQWSKDSRSCGFLANGLTHQYFRASHLRAEAQVAEVAKAAGWTKSP
jgi:hypothetical protein